MDDALQIHLAELDALISKARADGRIDEAERAEIAALVERVRDDLKAEEADREGLAEHLEETAVGFETAHPRVSEVLRAVSRTLSGFGI